MQSNAEMLKPKPKGQGKTNKKNLRSYGCGGRNGANSSTGDIHGHTSSPSTWPWPFMTYRGPPAPMTQIQPLLDISPNVYNPHVPAFQPHFGIPITSQPVPATIPILPPITPTFNQPRLALYFNDWSAQPIRSKPRFAPIIPPSAPRINSKMHWERETPHAIAIMDPESRKDIRKEYIENIRKCSSLREASKDATESTAQADSLVEETVFPIEEVVGVENLQFLHDSIISNEDITHGEFQHIVKEKQVSVIEESFDQIDKEPEAVI